MGGNEKIETTDKVDGELDKWLEGRHCSICGMNIWGQLIYSEKTFPGEPKESTHGGLETCDRHLRAVSCPSYPGLHSSKSVVALAMSSPVGI